MATIRISRIQLKRDTAANWAAINPVLFPGEAGFELDTGKLKIGSGSAAWNNLPYLNSGGGGGSVDLSNVNQNILPQTDNLYSLGSPSRRWSDLYVNSGSVYIGNVKLSDENDGTLSIRVGNGQVIGLPTGSFTDVYSRLNQVSGSFSDRFGSALQTINSVSSSINGRLNDSFYLLNTWSSSFDSRLLIVNTDVLSLTQSIYELSDSIIFFPNYKKTGWGTRLAMYKNYGSFKKSKDGLEYTKNKNKQGDIELLKDWIKNGIDVPINTAVRGHKNLIYFTVFGNQYINLLNILLKGLLKQSFKDFELLFITDKKTNLLLLKNRLVKKFKVNYHVVKSVKDGVDASVQKIKIFDYENINEYNKILFLDLDILVTGSLDKIFNQQIIPNIFYSAIHRFSHDLHRTDYHTVSPYTPNQLAKFLEKNIFAFNAGQFMFLNTQTMQDHFTNIKKFINTWNGKYFFEQSFMNTYFNVLQISNVFKFVDYFNFISINSQQLDYVPTQETVFVHYMGSVTDAKSKLAFMKEHYAHLLP